MTGIGEALASEWNAIRHHQDHPQTAQESHMSKLADARDAISAIADNPLIDAIAEAGIGKQMWPAEIQNLVGLWREVEHGRMQAAVQVPPVQQQPAQQQDARDLQPQ